ncbi:HlyD family secretion protein [Silvimonas amylolytica]|uniref:Secretion protein HlyD n=1 Tax=Silvimonas amylolytica TaxID=449663 RepID=A0ABQ2PS67_9NEIS|nr:HlyD family efflux transporter periplasmic adaptor subunit [Silvimonas amylolytica]GGP28292.1 secretion protein HlyD [Silvimonas amylolytica]
MRHHPLLALCPAFALFLGGCSEPARNTWQGYVEGEFVYVSSSQPGRLDQLSVQRGQQVRQGQPLFALEAQDEAAAQRQAQQQLRVALAQLADMRSGKRPPEIGVTRAQLAAAQVTYHHAQEQLERDEIQFAAGGVSRQQLDDSRASAQSAAAQVTQLKSQITVDELPGREQQMNAQSAQVAAARAAVEQASWKLDQKSVDATRTGLVFDTLYQAGEWVAAGNPVVRMLPPENIKVRFFVPEADVGRLKTGQAVTLHCDGCSSDVAARITFISGEVEYTPPVIYSNENRNKLVFMVEAHPDVKKASALHPGQPIEVRLND